jgi:HD-like signal output (HDOD) protein
MLDVSGEYAYDVLSCEEDLFDIDHCRAGEWLVQDWQLPDEFAEAAGAHHRVPASGCTDLAALVHYACGLADACGFPVLTSSAEDLHTVLERLPPKLAKKIGDSGEFCARMSEKVNAVENSV